MASTVARLEAILSAQTRDFDRAMDRSQGKMHRAGQTAGILGAALGGVLVYGLDRSVKSALHAQTSQARLEQAFKNAHLQIDPYTKAIEHAESAGRKLGFTDEDTKAALGSLITATGSYTKAAKELAVAQDVARFKGVTLVDATKMLTMAQTGSQRAAKQLGITVPTISTAYDALGKNASAVEKAQARMNDKLATGDAVIQAVSEHVRGQADAYAKTAAGALDIYRAQVEHLQVQLGKGLIPILTQLATAVATATEFLSRHTAAAKALYIALGVLATALLAAKIQQIALNLVVLANPYVAAAAALAVLIAATIRYREQIQATFNWIKEHWPLLADIIAGPLGFAIAKLIQNWGALVNAIQPAIVAVHGISSALSHLAGWLQKVIGYVQDLIGWLGKIHVPEIHLPHVPNPFGDGSGPPPSGKGPASINPSLWDELASAERFGLRLTSGYRPGAITKHGTPSDHGVYPSKAIDVSNGYNTPQEHAFFRSLIGDRGVKQAFFDPLGSIFGGVLSSYREGGHSDHVHVATYDKGGFLRPGWNLAYNGLGRPEPVGGDVVIPVSIGGEHIATVVFDMIRRKAKVFENRNGRAAFGGA